jgi:hypothetical protein
MSIDLYHFHMVVRQQEMIRSERLAADEQAASVAHALSDLGRTIARIARRPQRRDAAFVPARRSS